MVAQSTRQIRMTTKAKSKSAPKRVSIPVPHPVYQRCAKIAGSLKGAPSTVGLINDYIETGLAADEAKGGGHVRA